MRNIENQECISNSLRFSQLTSDSPFLADCTDKSKHFDSSEIDFNVTAPMHENNSRIIQDKAVNKSLINVETNENQLSLLDIIENTPIIKSKMDERNNELSNKEIACIETQRNDCIYLKYSKSVFMNCWSHLNDVEFKYLKAKLDKFEKCSIRPSKKDLNRYFCHECDLAFDLCFDAIVKHVMVGHCNIPRMMIDELIPLAMVDSKFRLNLNDTEITTRILEKRIGMPTVDNNKCKIDRVKKKEAKKRITKNYKFSTGESNDEASSICSGRKQEVYGIISTEINNKEDISQLKIGNGCHSESRNDIYKNTNATTERDENENEERIIARINEKRVRDGKDLIGETEECESSDSGTEFCDQPITREETEKLFIKKAPFCNKFKKGNVIKLKYSQRVFDKCFQRLDSTRITEIQSILDQFTIRRNGLKKIRYFCNECNASTTSSPNKIINHVMMMHCRFPDELRDELEVLVSLNRDLELISDREMITKINLIRSRKSLIDNQPELIDSDEDESCPINREQRLAEELKLISFNYWKSIFDKCFLDLSEESRLEIQGKIDNINRYSMKKMREPEDNIYYQCSECSFRHYTKAYNNFHPLKKHLLTAHCGISESIIDECLLLVGNKQNFTESDEKSRTEIINKLRNKKNAKLKKRSRVTIGNRENENGIGKSTIYTCRKRIAQTDDNSTGKRHKEDPTGISLLSANRNTGHKISDKILDSGNLSEKNRIEEFQYSNRAKKPESIEKGKNDNRFDKSLNPSCRIQIAENGDYSTGNQHDGNPTGSSLLSANRNVENLLIGRKKSSQNENLDSNDLSQENLILIDESRIDALEDLGTNRHMANASIQIHNQSHVHQVVTEFRINYSTSLLQILCSVEGKLEFYDDLIWQLNSVLDRKFTIRRQGADFIYGCLGCQLTMSCRQQLTQHVTLCHTDLSNDLRMIADNVIIIPINFSFDR